MTAPAGHNFTSGHTYPKFEVSVPDRQWLNSLPTITDVEEGTTPINTQIETGGPIQRSPKFYLPPDRKV